MHIGRNVSGKPCPTVLNMARKRKFVLQRRENIMKGREAFANGKRRKIKGKENSTLSFPTQSQGVS